MTRLPGLLLAEKTELVPNFLFRKKINLNLIDKFFYIFFFKNNRFLRKIFKMCQLFLKPENFHVGTHGSNLKFFLGNSFLIAEKKIKKIYEKFYKTSELVFVNKSNKELLEYNNFFLTIATQNYIFDQCQWQIQLKIDLHFLIINCLSLCLNTQKIRNKNGLKSFYKSILSEDLPDFVTKAKNRTKLTL